MDLTIKRTLSGSPRSYVKLVLRLPSGEASVIFFNIITLSLRKEGIPLYKTEIMDYLEEAKCCQRTIARMTYKNFGV